MDWKTAAREGQQAFVEHQYVRALACHRQALQQALAGFEGLARQDMDAAIASVVVSYINMAECHALLHQGDEVHRCLGQADAFIGTLCEQQTLRGSRACHRAASLLRQEALALLRRYAVSPDALGRSYESSGTAAASNGCTTFSHTKGLH